MVFNKVDPATVRVPALVYHFKEMDIDTIGIAVGQGIILGPVNVLIAVLAHAGIMKDTTDPLIVVNALRIVRNKDQGIRGM